MCLSDLGRVVDVDPGRRCATVDIGGRIIEVSTVTLGLDEPQPAVGDWLVVHTGFAVERLSATAAAEIHHARHELTPSAVEPTREEPS